MQTCERAKTLFVGVDVHKDTHTAVGLSPFGEKLFELTVGNSPKDFAELAKKVNATGKHPMLYTKTVSKIMDICHSFMQQKH